MTKFVFIPHRSLTVEITALLLSLDGARYVIDGFGLVIESGTKAHIRSALLGLESITGHWTEPETV